MELIKVAIGLVLMVGFGAFLLKYSMSIIAVAGNPNFDALLSTTLANYRNQLTDNLSKSTLLFWWLTTGNRIRYEDGGESIVVQLLYGKNTTVRSYNGYDTIDSTPQEGITSAKYPWKQVAGTVTISGKEQRQNSGRSRLIKLLGAKVTQLEISLRDEFNHQFFADGTGNDAKDMFGLQLIVEDATGSAWGTLAGIDRSDAANAWWRNQFIGGALSFQEGANAAGIKRMRTIYNNTSRGNEHPDLILSDQTTFELYEQALTPQERFEDKTVGDAGFQNLKFKGGVYGFDEQAPAGYQWHLNSDYLELVVDTETWMKPEEFQKALLQDAILSKNLTMANLTTSNSSRQGLANGFTA